MSLGMFCAVPLPFHIWDDACMSLMLPCLPLVGALLGAAWWGLAALLAACGVHTVLAAAAVAAAPSLLTGFLHLDGYMDASDAILSRRGYEEKLKILKDPHKGAFSMIMLTLLFMLQYAAAYTVLDLSKNPAPLIFIAAAPRCCASASLLFLNVMPQSGYVNMFRRDTGARHKIFVLAVFGAAVAASFAAAGLPGLISAASACAGFICAMAYSYKEFKGVSGDLAGFSIVIGELCGLIALGVA